MWIYVAGFHFFVMVESVDWEQWRMVWHIFSVRAQVLEVYAKLLCFTHSVDFLGQSNVIAYLHFIQPLNLFLQTEALLSTVFLTQNIKNVAKVIK